MFFICRGVLAKRGGMARMHIGNRQEYAMADRRERKSWNRDRRIRAGLRVRTIFDQASVAINGVDPIYISDPKLPFYLYLERNLYDSLDTEYTPDLPA